MISSWIRNLGVVAITFCLVKPFLAQTVRQPQSFFKESVGLTDGQIASIQQGKTTARVLSTRSPSEIAVFGATFINASPEDYLAAMQNLDRLRKSPNFLAIRQFSIPPKLSDLEAFTLEDDDIKEIGRAHV